MMHESKSGQAEESGAAPGQDNGGAGKSGGPASGQNGSASAPLLDELLAAVERVVPLAGEVRSALGAVLRGVLERSGWVTMDELEARTEVLRHNRKRIEELERRVAELEKAGGKGGAGKAGGGKKDAKAEKAG